jgi:hypothetical protein
MDDWRTPLKADPTDWLLEKENPSVRYFTMRDILDRPEDEPETEEAGREIMRAGLVPELLLKMSQPFYIKEYPRFYIYKYEGLVWQTLLLAELGARADRQIRDQCEYLLAHSQETGDGGFSMHEAVKTGGGRITEVIPCLTGIRVWSLIKLGYLDDPRVQKGIGWFVKFMVYNDGIEETPQVAPYDKYEMCWGRHTCHMGVVKALKALGAIPPDRRTEEIHEAIGKASEFLLIHHIYKQSHALSRVSKPGWRKFGFPLMYQTDVLEILDILTALGVADSRMDEALELVISKQNEAGRWVLENTYNSDRLLIPMGQKGEPSKWLTLRALRILKRRYGQDCK